ncbi:MULTISPECIES: flavin reductase family protein [unclassified Thermosipho (in: thermotogales)]|uniref:flavin reductase family protein n=1 Tax=unclassified Thermosipho (in: thermotogales) TaxID=2676525 RepID=UPI0009860C98|nr:MULTISPECIES: flavin reductase family protein [unclassified Thermosipho (in: thermotogales)]MBT1248757.1 flavin oxidoreductase [Thermosipho sp. 1244]OOC47681.1 flavin oxidoreductase [Thermosipho sp. 1223]
MDVVKKIYNSTVVVTMRLNDKINGISVAWITRVSINPKLIAISIGKERFSYLLLKSSSFFGVNILSKFQKDLAIHFGSVSGRDYDKFEGIDYELSKNGIPILKGIVGYIECEIVRIYDAGDHSIFVGKVIDEKLYNDVEPLLYGEHKILEGF